MDDEIHRLEGSTGGKGGLVIMKKKATATENPHTFKKPELPRMSLLGLDRLAVAKRESQEDNDGGATPKRSKISSYQDDDEEDIEEDRDYKKKKSKDKDRY